MDSVPERLALSERFGAVAVNREEKDAAQVVRCGLHCCWHALFVTGCVGHVNPLRCVTALCGPCLPALLRALAGRRPGGGGLMLCWKWWAAPQPCEPLTTWCAQAAPSPLLAATQVGALQAWQAPQAAMQLAGATLHLLIVPGLQQPEMGQHACCPPADATFPFSPVDGYNKNLTYRSGRCSAR